MEPGAPGEEPQPTDPPQATPELPPSRAERALGQLSDDLRDLKGRLGRVTRAERQLERRKRRQLARQDRISRAIDAAESRAAWAAAGLSEQIRRMTVLAERRATERTGPMVAGTHLEFTWPTRKRITQPYGCTGFSLEPARGSCAHFHDGIDLGPGYGAKVVAPADGVVAYVGWSPLGAGDRSFIVVMAHRDGHETSYAHLLPSEHVRVGQWVAQGETIGLVGDTGRSTGSHLHWEVRRNGRTVDPESVIRSSSTLDEPVIDPAASAPSGLGDDPSAAPGAAADIDPLTGYRGDMDAEAGAPGGWSLPSLGPDPAQTEGPCLPVVTIEALAEFLCAGGS